MDLFTPVVAESDMHPNFKGLLDSHSAADREVLNQWAAGFIDRDGKFVREFQTTFNSCFWELYLFACCKDLGFRIDLSHSSPDFIVSEFQNDFCIEAVIASNAEGEKPEYERDLSAVTPPEEILHTAVVRLSNAIRSKHQKYLKSYQSLAHVRKRPFVLAVGPFEQPYFFAQNDHAIRQVLYGFDRVGPTGESRWVDTVIKRSGAEIPLGLFASDVMPEISAVLFSNTATFSKLHALNSEQDEHMIFEVLSFNHFGPEPKLSTYTKPEYHESLLDGLYVFHNRHARYPLPLSYFDHEDVTQGALVDDTRIPKYKCRHGSLIQRACFRIRAKG